jgi:peptidyl-prolyl cis-trans isomerase B (cyclophilin B)
MEDIRMKKMMILSLLALALLLTGCGTNNENAEEETGTGTETGQEENVEVTGGFPQLSQEVDEDERLVEMKTSLGTVKIKLFPEHAPKAVENFITHSENGYYDGVIFHRVIKGFMIQGGDPEGTGMGGESIYGEPFENEISLNLYHLRGALSMANAGPDTNGSQFFIVQNSSLNGGLKDGLPEEIAQAYQENGGTPHLDTAHTVFGQVIEGMEVIDEIAGVETGAGDKPVEDVVIQSVNVLQ